MHLGICFALLFSLSALGSCHSLSAKFVGQPQHGESVGGLPIVVERPRYLQLTHKLVDIYTLKPSSNGHREYDLRTVSSVESTVLNIGEVYAINIDRPLSGKLDYGLDFTPGKFYPKSISGKGEENQTEQIASAVKDGIREATVTQTTGGMRHGSDVYTVERVTLIEIFDLNTMAPVRAFKPGE